VLDSLLVDERVPRGVDAATCERVLAAAGVEDESPEA
jgi:hypothetical protein